MRQHPPLSVAYYLNGPLRLYSPKVRMWKTAFVSAHKLYSLKIFYTDKASIFVIECKWEKAFFSYKKVYTVQDNKLIKLLMA